MNILFLTSTLPRFNGDARSPFVLEQAIAWKRERPRDTVIVLAPDDALLPEKEEVIENVLIKRFTYVIPRTFQLLAYRPTIYAAIKRNKSLICLLPFLFISQIIATIRVVEKYNIQLLYAHWFIPQGFVSLMVYYYFLTVAKVKNKKCSIRYAVHNHSTDLIRLRSLSLLGPFFAKTIIRNACKVFCVNTRLKDEILSLFSVEERLKIEKKLFVHSMGIQPITNMRDVSYSRKYDLGFIGRFAEEKGLTYFLRALEKLDKVHGILPKVGIAGGTKQEVNTSVSAEFLGFLTGNQKHNFLHRTYCLVFPSLSEGLPVAMLEALLYGKTILVTRATNIQTLPEWNDIKDDVYLIEDSTNTKEFVRVLQTVLNKKKKTMHNPRLSRIMKHYQWNYLIKDTISLLNKS